nr:MAG TPA: hypothetical protein [Caudoviricetes sp.]
MHRIGSCSTIISRMSWFRSRFTHSDHCVSSFHILTLYKYVP